MRRWLVDHWIAAVSPLVLVALWEWASASGLLREAFFPRPLASSVNVSTFPPIFTISVWPARPAYRGT